MLPAFNTHLLEIKLRLLSDGGVGVKSRLDPVPQAGNVHGCEYLARFAARIGDGLKKAKGGGCGEKWQWGIGRDSCCLCTRKQRLGVRIGGRDCVRIKARVLFPSILRLVGLVQLVRDVMMEGQ
jgi:hypothetical protein